jgi:hypothetical protein
MANHSRLTARLEVLDSTDIPGARHAHVESDGRKSPLFQPLDRDRVLPKVKLGADEDERDTWSMMRDFGYPLRYVRTPLPRS